MVYIHSKCKGNTLMEVWNMFFHFLREVRKQIDLHRKIEFLHCGARWKNFLTRSKLKSSGFPWVLKVLLVIELSCAKIYREMHKCKSCRSRGIIPLCIWIHSVFFRFFFLFGISAFEKWHLNWMFWGARVSVAVYGQEQKLKYLKIPCPPIDWVYF